MQAKTDVAYKAEITKRLDLVKSLVEQIIFAVESENDWKDVHSKTEKAIAHLTMAIKLIAKYHIEICVVEKLQRNNEPILPKDIEEIIKTYRYLS